APFAIRSEVVPNIIDLTRFAFRRRMPLRPNLLSTRNFEPMYNVACTLRAFARGQARYPGATLTLVGAGSQERSLRTLAEQAGLHHVIFAGPVPNSEIHRCYSE